jgi:crossover junction endodeoxyribonuclease RuvC
VGIDPGITVTGYGVICGEEPLQVISMGEVRPGVVLTLGERLDIICSGIERILDQTSPEAVAVEGLFHAKNAASAFKLAHARGVVFLAAARRGIPVFEYAPREVKSAVTGYGAAEKAQVESMVRAILCIKGKTSEHICDALAVAVCHLHTRKSHLNRGAL